MELFRIDINLADHCSEEDAEAAAVVLRSELKSVPAIGDSDVQRVAPDRSLSVVIQTIAVAAPIVKSAAEALKALVQLFKSLRGDQKKKMNSGHRVLAKIPAENILVRIGRKYIPLSEVTVEDLKDA